MNEKVKFENIERVKEFAFAGKATVTLESAVTGKHFTYKINKNKTDETMFFVSLLTGSDNENSFSYLGTIFNKKDFRLTKKSKITNTADSFKAFDFFFKCLDKNFIHTSLNVYHSGKCGRCGRKLTTPESINRGIGPECFKISGAHVWEEII